MAGDVGGGDALQESMQRALTLGDCETGQITVSTRVAHALGFRSPNLVEVYMEQPSRFVA